VIATWFGCGYFPWAPGTVGSAAAIIIAALLHAYAGAGRWTLLLLTVIFLAPAIWSATQTEREVKKKDPGIVVIDEVLGQWITLLGAASLGLEAYVAGFVLFRIFDVLKPWPVRQFEKLREGVGIVVDDLAAGAYAAFVLYVGGVLKLY